MGAFPGELHLGVEQPIAAEIFLEGRGLKAVAISGAVHRIHYRDLVVDAEPADGTIVARSTRDGVAVSSRASGFLTALEKAGVKLDDHVLQSLAERRKRSKGLRWFAAVMGGSLALILLVFALPYIAVLAVDFLPHTIDRQLGDATGENVDLGPEVTDVAIVAAMQRMLEHFEPHARAEDFELRVRVVDNPLLNAFALPGGTILMTTGLLEVASGPEEVAAVLAHEIAHVTLRHGLRRFLRGAGFTVMIRLFFGDDDGVANLMAQGAAVAVILGHSREHESAADMEALRTMHASGLHGSALRDILIAMHARSPAPKFDVPEWASTHPNIRARTEAIEAALAAMDPIERTSLEVNWSEVRNALARR